MSMTDAERGRSRSEPAFPYGVTVEFTLRPGTLDAFLRLVEANAAASVADEPGCLRFDVLLPAGGEGPDVFLYEIYADRAAFDHHLTTTHFLAFDEATGPMVERKAAGFFSVRENAKVVGG
jgi:(4S)-4-hydroxy-5-phosphonooxypentane-2,3-dione isomerase